MPIAPDRQCDRRRSPHRQTPGIGRDRAGDWHLDHGTALYTDQRQYRASRAKINRGTDGNTFTRPLGKGI